MSSTGFFVDGAWVEPMGSETLPVVNPATEAVIGEVRLGNEADVDRAVAAARAAFPAFAATPLEDRIALLERIVEEYKARFDDIGKAISQEMGAPLAFATRFQAGAGLSHFKEILKVLKSFEFESERGATRIVREPIGVAGMIVPWNWPMNQVTCKVAPALAAGCTMVLKPSEMTPSAAAILTEILDAAGVPPGVFNVVSGVGPVVGAAMASHPDIDVISFTGSTQAGIAVAIAAAPSVKRVGQELGGKSANILLDDVDLADAVKRGVTLCFRNSGQSCNSPTRMLVPKIRMAEAAEIAAGVAKGMVVGDPNDAGTAIGPVVNKVQYEKIQAHIQSGLSEGADLVAGGPDRPSGLDRGFYVQPTVFAGVTPDMTIAKEEIFGPVLSILGYEDEDDAVQIANASPFGLAAYVESADLERSRAIARRLRVGMVHLNGAVADPGAPFGGYRQSGNGREWGVAGLEEFLETKSIMGYAAG